MKTLLFDLDGVLANFDKGINPFAPNRDRTNFFCVSLTLLKSLQYSFWNSLEKHKDGDDLLYLLYHNMLQNCRIGICSHAIGHYSLAGKQEWVEYYYPELSTSVVYTKHKELLSRKDTILIDDANHNIDAFNKGEGKGLLIPRIWNRRANEVNKNNEFNVQSIFQELKGLIEC